MDFGIRKGQLKAMTGKRFPRGLGHDLSGVVEAVGAGVTRFRVGDEVVGFAGIKTSGAYGEVAIVEDKACAKKPAGLSFEEATTLPVPAGTAFQALVDNGRLKSGQSVFVTGCLGGVGRSAVAIALARGAKVAGSARESAADEARALGVETVVGFGFDPKDLAGRFDTDYVYVWVDGIGPGVLREAPLRGWQGDVEKGRPVRGHYSEAGEVRPCRPAGRLRGAGHKTNPDELVELLDLAAKGKLRLPIERTVPSREAVAALTDWETNPKPGRGKLVVTSN